MSSEDARYTEETSVEKKFPKYREGSTCFCDVWAPGSSCIAPTQHVHHSCVSVASLMLVNPESELKETKYSLMGVPDILLR